eukprot:NODE_4351_length_811_cov_7.909449_g3606_i0.p5 GENE.NODE_4351_length_811_cov_7.909449_g3606_i0~~NODE_4351_length_811_cov_7.909449_g3606_i0.p5  ORF type:complete len:56 (-),score=2.93 NODE_4351_length_811_cov_7.909449_g3606_i0:252-419(-)
MLTALGNQQRDLRCALSGQGSTDPCPDRAHRNSQLPPADSLSGLLGGPDRPLWAC